MAMTNTFVVIDCKQRKVILATPSARKAQCVLRKGLKVEVWIDGIHIETVYSNQTDKLKPFTLQEKQWISNKQKRAEEKNKRRISGK